LNAFSINLSPKIKFKILILRILYFLKKFLFCYQKLQALGDFSQHRQLHFRNLEPRPSPEQAAPQEPKNSNSTLLLETGAAPQRWDIARLRSSRLFLATMFGKAIPGPGRGHLCLANVR